MKQSGIGWQGWAGAAMAAVALVVLLSALFRIPAIPTGPAAKPGVLNAPVGLVTLRDSDDRLLREDANLRDPTPLFLPTQWNAADSAASVGTRRGAGLSFRGYGEKLSFSSSALQLQLPAAVKVPGRVADAFTGDHSAVPLQGFGETDEPAPSLAPRAAFVEVVDVGSGQLVWSQSLREAQPPGEFSWQPLEFLVAVDRSGVVRPPVLTLSSRIPAVDAYFQAYLTGTLHIGARVPPGFYRIGFGP